MFCDCLFTIACSEVRNAALTKILVDKGKHIICAEIQMKGRKRPCKGAILRCVHVRNVAWGREIAFRNLAVSDLHAADDIYPL